MLPVAVLAIAKSAFTDLPPLPAAARDTPQRRGLQRARRVSKRCGPIGLVAALGIGAFVGPLVHPQAAIAQEPVEAAACRKASIATLKEAPGNSPLKDVKLDLDSLTIAKANAEVGGAKIATVLIGQAAIQRESSDEPHTFLCLLGDNQKVLMTFFTKR